MDEKWSIDKLDSSNWVTWKFQMKHMLMAKGLWGLVEGAEGIGRGANAEAEFQKKSQRAFSHIILNISTPQLYLVTSYEEPQDAWVALCRHFERGSLANKLFLKKKYFRMEMKEGVAVESHLKQMKELTDKLAAIGAPIEEEDQVVTLLGSLPKSYSTLVTALEAQAGNDIQLSFVHQALLNEELKHKGQCKSSQMYESRHPEESVLLGKQQKRNPKFQNPRFQSGYRNCYSCGSPDHLQNNCPTMKTSHHGRFSGQRFGSSGHHKADIAEEKEESSDEVSDSSQIDSISFVASIGPVSFDKNRDAWVIDSGATRHMTHEKEMLVNFKAFERPERISVGDGRVIEAIGVGNVKVNLVASAPKRAIFKQVLYVPELAANLFSVKAATAKGCVIQFGHTRCWLKGSDGSLIGMGTLVGSLYHLDCKKVPVEHVNVAVEQRKVGDQQLQKFNHVKEQQLRDVSGRKQAQNPRNQRDVGCKCHGYGKVGRFKKRSWLLKHAN